MVSFEILQKDPADYRETIISLWRQYLPGTPEQRYDWLCHENPAGAAFWFFAFDPATGELAGLISLMLRQMFLDGKPKRVGILGDFIVTKNFRVYGPGLLLPKTVLERYTSLGFDGLYTIPNAESLKIMIRVGMTERDNIRHLIKPLALQSYLRSRHVGLLASVFAPLGNLALRFLSRETYALRRGIVREESDVDESFDALWAEVKSRHPGLIGDRSAVYLRWKFLRNPLLGCRVITVRAGAEETLRGYLLFEITGDRLAVVDLLAAERPFILSLLRATARIARVEGCKAIYLRIGSHDPVISLLSQCLFVDARDELRVFVHAPEKRLFDHWYFVDGDRNI
jgi:hypothetical protein